MIDKIETVLEWVVIVIIVAVVISCDGSRSGTRTETKSVRYCPGGVCADGSFVPHWRVEADGSRVWVEVKP